MYKKYEILLSNKGVTSADVSRATGINQSTFSEWKKGKATPKIDKLQKIAEFFGVPVDFFLSGSSDSKAYYFDDQTAALAQEIMERKDLRVLMDASRDLSPENAALVVDLVKKLKGTNPNG